MTRYDDAPPPLVFLDTETDGIHPDRKVWEIAMIRRTFALDGQPHEESTQFYVEIDLSTADPFGLAVGRFYDRHPLGRHISGARPVVETYMDLPMVESEPSQYLQEDMGCASQSDAALTVARWTHGAHLVGAVPNFDAEVLSTLLRDNGLTPSWHYHLIDVEAMAVGWLHSKGDDIPLPWNSKTLSRSCGVLLPDPDAAHTALGDAEWVRRWYDALTSAAKP